MTAFKQRLALCHCWGILLDVVWKANLRNVAIIDEHFGMI